MRLVTPSALLCLMLLGSGCSTLKPTEIKRVAVERQKLALKPVSPLKMSRVRWIVLTEENQQEIFDAMKRRGKLPVLFAMTNEDYQVMSLNFADIRGYVLLTKGQLEAYKNYYEKNK